MKKIITLIVLGKVLFAQDLSPIIVNSEKLEEETSLNQHLNSADIEDMISANGDIPSLLKNNPNVKIVEDKSDPSSIEPAKIKINEAKFYQNTFVLDGLSADSLLDPASYNRIDDVKGNENELFLDLDLIEKISVFDSGISAEYGNFSGGVIDVQLKNPSPIPSGKVNYRYTSDAFVKKHLAKGADASSIKKPEFKKRTFNATYSGPINDKSGIIFSHSNKEGSTPKAYFDGYENIKNSSSNTMLKYTRYFDDDSLGDVSLIYAPFKSESLRGRYIKDSQYSTNGGSVSLNSHYEKNFDTWSLDSNISIKASENKRETKNSYIKNWVKKDSKDWGVQPVSGDGISEEGSWGDIEKRQKSILSKIKLTRELDRHFINTGLELNYIKGTHKRFDDLIVYDKAVKNQNIRCNGYTEDCVQYEQYFSERKIYQKENVKASMFSFAYYLEDTYKYKNIKLQMGLRSDYNDFLKNFDLAPRFNPEISFFDNKTRVFGGLNRYYGKSFLSNKLREARTPYKNEYRGRYQNELNSNNIPSDQVNTTVWNIDSQKGTNRYIFSNLETPYTDEFLLGLSQKISNNVVKLKYVKRKARKQFMENIGKKQKFTRPDGELGFYTPKSMSNAGKSNTDVYSLNISSISSLPILSSRLSYSFSVSKSKNDTNFISYNTDDEEDISKVMYKGKEVNKSSLENYSRPERYSLFLKFKTPAVDFFDLKGSLSKSVLFSYTASYIKPTATDAKSASADGGLVEYEDKKISHVKNLDLKLAFDTKFSKNRRLRLSADIFNVLDEVSGEDSNNYELGRSFWLGAEYKF